LDPEGEGVDMFGWDSAFHQYAPRASGSSLTKRKERHSRHLTKEAAQLVIEEATFLVSTNNNAGDGMIATHFGKEAKVIIQIRTKTSRKLNQTAGSSLPNQPFRAKLWVSWVAGTKNNCSFCLWSTNFERVLHSDGTAYGYSSFQDGSQAGRTV
jgi:hypothetical protein